MSAVSPTRTLRNAGMLSELDIFSHVIKTSHRCAAKILLIYLANGATAVVGKVKEIWARTLAILDSQFL